MANYGSRYSYLCQTMTVIASYLLSVSKPFLEHHQYSQMDFIQLSCVLSTRMKFIALMHVIKGMAVVLLLKITVLKPSWFSNGIVC